MNVNWAATLLGLISVFLTCSLFMFFKFGSRMRYRSEFAPCFVSFDPASKHGNLFTIAQDLNIAKELERRKTNAVV